MAAPDEPPVDSAGYLDGRILVPGLGGVLLLVAAGLLWVGAHGYLDGYRALFWGGILGVALGVSLVALLGVFPLGVVSLGGVGWLVLERAALAVGPSLGWAAPALAVVGVLLLPAPVARLRIVAAERRVWARLKGGSVPP